MPLVALYIRYIRIRYALRRRYHISPRHKSMDTILKLIFNGSPEEICEFLLITSSQPIYTLGKEYSASTEIHNVLKHMLSMYHLTYRYDFPPLASFTTDVGWGCMLRSGQMLMSHVFSRHRIQKGWRFSDHVQSHTPLDSAYFQTLEMFIDTPDAPFSIHKIATCGAQMDIPIGQWFGPSTLCHALRRLTNDQDNIPISVHVALDSVLDMSQVTIPSNTSHAVTPPCALILVPIRLGLNTLQPEFIPQLLAFFTWPGFAGVVGGKPRASLYFIGRQDTSLFYLDPHRVQPFCPNLHDPQSIPTYHSPMYHMLPIHALDPSLALAFVCYSTSEIEDLSHRIQDLGKTYSQPLFTITQPTNMANMDTLFDDADDF